MDIWVVMMRCGGHGKVWKYHGQYGLMVIRDRPSQNHQCSGALNDSNVIYESTEPLKGHSHNSVIFF